MKWFCFRHQGYMVGTGWNHQTEKPTQTSRNLPSFNRSSFLHHTNTWPAFTSEGASEMASLIKTIIWGHSDGHIATECPRNPESWCYDRAVPGQSQRARGCFLCALVGQVLTWSGSMYSYSMLQLIMHVFAVVQTFSDIAILNKCPLQHLFAWQAAMRASQASGSRLPGL